MNFKQEFLTALHSGQDYGALMELVRRHKSQGLSVDDAYQTLQDIWREKGFDDQEGAPLQDELEAVMEKVWYGYPVVEKQAQSNS